MVSEDMPGMVAGEVKPQRMLYQLCPICDGTRRCVVSKPGAVIEASVIGCICKTGYVPVGVVMSQLEHLAQVNELRQKFGITMAMLREGRCGPIEKPAPAGENYDSR